VGAGARLSLDGQIAMRCNLIALKRQKPGKVAKEI
jgi:hypothetical protein